MERRVMRENNICKHSNNSFHNTHCNAGVCYRDVTTEPDRLEGSVFRMPCVVWGERDWDNERQKIEYAKRGTCDKFELPTNEEFAAEKAALEARVAEVVESINNGIVPDGVMVCGSSWGMGVTTFPNEPSDSEFSEIYGFGMGGDPHDFEPDYDSNTKDEIAAWEKAKAECDCGREDNQNEQ